MHLHNYSRKEHVIRLFCFCFALLHTARSVPLRDSTGDSTDQSVRPIHDRYGHLLPQPISIKFEAQSAPVRGLSARKLTMLDKGDEAEDGNSFKPLEAIYDAKPNSEPDIIKNYTPNSAEGGSKEKQKTPFQKALRVLMPISSKATIGTKEGLGKVSICI